MAMTTSLSRLSGPGLDVGDQICLSTNDAIFTARPTATVPYANVTASYGPRTTGVPFLGTFCDGVPIQTQECTYYAGVEFRYYLPEQTYKIAVATVFVNVYEYRNETSTTITTVARDAAVTSSELLAYQSTALPAINFSPSSGMWNWWGTDFYYMAQYETTYEYGGAIVTSGTAKGFVRDIDVSAAATCGQGRSFSTKCFVDDGRPHVTIDLPVNDPKFDLRTWSSDEQRLDIPGMRTGFEEYWPHLSSCDPYIFGFPVPMYVVETLTDTKFSTIRMVPPGSSPNSQPNQPGNQPPPPAGQPALAAPSATTTPFMSPPVPAAPGNLSPPPPPTTIAVPLPSTTANIVFQPGASQAVVGSQTLSKNGPAVTVGGNAVLSWGSAGVVVSNSQGGNNGQGHNGAQVATIPLPSAVVGSGSANLISIPAAGQGRAGSGVVTIGSQTIGYSMEGSGSGSEVVVMGSVTLKVGSSAVTVSGTVMSLGSAGLVVGGGGKNGGGPSTTIALTGGGTASGSGAGGQGQRTSSVGASGIKNPIQGSGGKGRKDNVTDGKYLASKFAALAFLLFNLLFL